MKTYLDGLQEALAIVSSWITSANTDNRQKQALQAACADIQFRIDLAEHGEGMEA